MKQNTALSLLVILEKSGKSTDGKVPIFIEHHALETQPGIVFYPSNIYKRMLLVVNNWFILKNTGRLTRE